MATKEYHVEFDTKEMPGRIVAVRVRLDKEFVVDRGRSFHINLCDDPLYAALERYVLANPSRKR